MFHILLVSTLLRYDAQGISLASDSSGLQKVFEPYPSAVPPGYLRAADADPRLVEIADAPTAKLGDICHQKFLPRILWKLAEVHELNLLTLEGFRFAVHLLAPG